MNDTDLLEGALADFHAATFADKPLHAARLAVITAALGISSLAAGEPGRALLYMAAAGQYAALGVLVGGMLKRWPGLGGVRRQDIVITPWEKPSPEFIEQCLAGSRSKHIRWGST